MLLRITTLLTLIAALITSGGCTSLTQVRFTVEPSSLDYAIFRHTDAPSSDDDSHPRIVQLELNGSGYLEYRAGRSERVSDNFWQESESPLLQDMRVDHAILSQDETVEIYQQLVDAGIFDMRQDPELPPHALAVLACIKFEKRLILTSDPVYVKIFDELLDHFE